MIFDVIKVFGCIVDIVQYDKGVALINVSRKKAVTILTRAWDYYRRSHPKVTDTKKVQKEILANFDKWPAGFDYPGGTITQIKNYEGITHLVFSDAWVDVTIMGPNIVEFSNICDVCGRYGRIKCESCQFRYCTIMCAWANPHCHAVGCEL